MRIISLVAPATSAPQLSMANMLDNPDIELFHSLRKVQLDKAALEYEFRHDQGNDLDHRVAPPMQ